MVNDDFTPRKINGNKVVGLKNVDDLKIIGYLD